MGRNLLLPQRAAKSHATDKKYVRNQRTYYQAFCDSKILFYRRQLAWLLCSLFFCCFLFFFFDKEPRLLSVIFLRIIKAMNAILTASHMPGLHPKLKNGRKFGLGHICCESAFGETSKQTKLSPKCHRHVYAGRFKQDLFRTSLNQSFPTFLYLQPTLTATKLQTGNYVFFQTCRLFLWRLTSTKRSFDLLTTLHGF